MPKMMGYTPAHSNSHCWCREKDQLKILRLMSRGLCSTLAQLSVEAWPPQPVRKWVGALTCMLLTSAAGCILEAWRCSTPTYSWS